MIHFLTIASRINEVNACAIRIQGAYIDSGLEDAYLTPLFTILKTETDNLTLAIRRSKKESELESKNEIRDEKVNALRYLVKGYTHHPTTEIKSAATSIEKIFGKYATSITNESYATETSLIASLLTDLSPASVQASIALLSGCTEVVSALELAQSDFENTRIAYEKEKGAESLKTSATVLKKTVLQQINNKIIVYMRAMLVVNEATFGEFARTLEAIVSDNNETVKMRN